MADVNLSYGRLSAIPSDVQFSIFLNTPPDSLDDLCQNDIFFQWCRNSEYLMQYINNINPQLLINVDGFIIAADQLVSRLLSKFLSERWINTVDMLDQAIKFDTTDDISDRRWQIQISRRPRFVRPEIVDFCKNANFGFLRNAIIPVNEILSIITEYGLAPSSLI